jgi:hypothetical protein
MLCHKKSISLSLLTLHQQAHIFVLDVLVIKSVVVLLEHLHLLLELALVQLVLFHFVPVSLNFLVETILHSVEVLLDFVDFVCVELADAV